MVNLWSFCHWSRCTGNEKMMNKEETIRNTNKGQTEVKPFLVPINMPHYSCLSNTFQWNLWVCACVNVTKAMSVTILMSFSFRELVKMRFVFWISFCLSLSTSNSNLNACDICKTKYTQHNTYRVSRSSFEYTLCMILLRTQAIYKQTIFVAYHGFCSFFLPFFFNIIFIIICVVRCTVFIAKT